MAHIEAGTRIGGAYRQRYNKRNEEENKEQEKKERRTSGASHPVSPGERSQERYTEMKKDKSPEGKGSWDNLN